MLTARALYANQVRTGEAQFDILDWSSLIAGTRVAAGLDGFDSSKVGGMTHVYQSPVNVLLAATQ